MSQMTKRALEVSLKKLLLQKPLNKITISDITENCGISRMTFYYHFKDMSCGAAVRWTTISRSCGTCSTPSPPLRPRASVYWTSITG